MLDQRVDVCGRGTQSIQHLAAIIVTGRLGFGKIRQGQG